MSEPATRMPAAPSSLDQICLRGLEQSNLMGRSEIFAVRAWWERERLPDESLAMFLQRCGVFHRNAQPALDLIARGYTPLTNISHLFTAHGFAVLRRRIAGGPEAQPVNKELLDTSATISGSDTVCDDVPSEPPLSPTVTVGTIPILGRDGTVAEIAVPPESMIGRSLRGIRLLRFIGRGARSLVFEGEESATGRRIAIKILPVELLKRGAIWKERFVHEARIALKLNHPLLLNALGFGEDGDYSYYTMPLMTAGSTRGIMRAQQPYSAYAATRIAIEVSRALEVLHALGIAHGNLKPSNVFETPHGVVKVADAAPALPAKARSSGSMTIRPTEIMSDIRLLASTWHWWLTGRPPGQSPGGSALPGPCYDLLMRAIAPARGEGFQSAAELTAALIGVADELRGEQSRVNARSHSQVTTAEPGMVLGKCLLTERVGQGSSSIVFRARHLSLNVQVAVKVLRAAVDARANREFQREARLMAKLNHPNIVRVWDFIDDPIHPALVLEFLDGANLAELIRQCGRLQPDRCIRIVTQIAAGLEAALQLGIVHRDVKPGNILISHDGTAKLTDLGVAVVIGMAAHSGIAGTVAYMAPEQAANSGMVDHRSDIYSLGATFYHLVTGRIPFQGATCAEIVEQHERVCPIAPTDLVPGLDAEVDKVMLKMMAKSPSDRHATYEELLTALHQLAERPSAPTAHHPQVQSIASGRSSGTHSEGGRA